MKLRILLAISALTFPAVMLAGTPVDSAAISTQPVPFQVSQKTEVPNVVLKPGSYTVRVVDHLADRVIVEVQANGKVQTTFLGIPAPTMGNSPVGPIRYSVGPGGKAALKGFAFPGGAAVEFVYPKADAVSIAKANDTRVMAIDPASEGRLPASKLNQQDMQMVTLWMLEPARVGPGDAKPNAISATKYEPPVRNESAPMQTAQASPTSDTMAASASPRTDRAARTHTTRPVQLAQNEPPAPLPVHARTRTTHVNALPHTASDLPLFLLATLLSLAVAASLSLRRLAINNG